RPADAKNVFQIDAAPGLSPGTRHLSPDYVKVARPFDRSSHLNCLQNSSFRIAGFLAHLPITI
ncbi:MAG: hypothetical protein ACRYFU_00430, partial [Janthinobacterium lividum]